MKNLLIRISAGIIDGLVHLYAGAGVYLGLLQPMTLLRSLCLAVAIPCVWPLVVCADMLVDGFTDATNDRFTNSASFIADGYDLSGIGRSGNRWATLVSENVVISAEHFHPAVGATVVFYTSNDPLGASISRQIAASQRVGSSDVWIGLLDEDVPAGYTPLPFATETITSKLQFQGSSLYQTEVFTLGVSATDPALGLDFAVGANIFDHWFDSATVGSTTDDAVGAIRNESGDANYVAYETYLQTYDSGAPLLRNIGGALTVIGLNWFINDDSVDIDPHPKSQTLRDVSGFSYVGNYAADIQAVINAYTGTAGGYRAWVGVSFAEDTDLTLTEPSADFDGDGFSNQDEYALGLDPETADDPAAEVPHFELADINGSFHGQLAITAREDGVTYQVEVGNDLSGWSPATLIFSGSWSTSDAGVATVASATDHGDGSWSLVVRDATPLSTGQARFLRLVY